MRDQPWDRPEPEEVVRSVDQYVSKMHHDAESASNVNLLDDSQVYSLHLLASEVYGVGYRDGRRSADARHDGERQRRYDRDRDRNSAVVNARLMTDALVRLGHPEVPVDEVVGRIIDPLLTMVATLLPDDPEHPLMAEVGVSVDLANTIHARRSALAHDAREALG